jgi:hypothetical protein
MLLPSLADFLWYGVIGGAGIHYDVTAVLNEHGLESAIFAIVGNLPLAGLVAARALGIASFSCSVVFPQADPSSHPGQGLREGWEFLSQRGAMGVQETCKSFGDIADNIIRNPIGGFGLQAQVELIIYIINNNKKALDSQ